MTTSTFPSRAKLNLHLQVVGHRADGYHELRTVFTAIDLHDTIGIALAESGDITLKVAAGDAPSGDANLAYRAAAAYRERWAPELGIALELRKRIPMGGGLGGGSSNAASVLRGLRALTGQPRDRLELLPVARELGADVPFFLSGGLAVGFGRGDELLPLPDLSAPKRLWLIVPPVAVETAAAFRALGDLTAKPLPLSIFRSLSGGEPSRWEDLLGWNDFQPTILRRFADIAEAHDELLACGASWVRLSGSGAALFADFADPDRAAEAVRRLGAKCRCEPIATVPRALDESRWRAAGDATGV